MKEVLVNQEKEEKGMEKVRIVPSTTLSRSRIFREYMQQKAKEETKEEGKAE